jgi:cytochrome o ubiquinol oxidase subunit II
MDLAITTRRLKTVAGKLLAFGLPALSGCHAVVLDPQGPVGAANRTILLDSLAIMLAIVVPTILATIGIAWWYRASNKRARYLPTWSFSGKVELVVWSIPLMVIILLGGVAWIGSHQLDPAEPIASTSPPLEIQVVSLDWKWLFIYPNERVALVNQLVIPAGVPVHFRLTSASVMNAFFIPQLGSMIYTMNGMATELWLRADSPGTFRGLSSHYSGEGFSDMHFEVRAVPTDQFAGWVASTRGSGTALDVAAYSTLAKPSAKVAPSAFAAVDQDLFKKIVALDIAPGPGPTTEHQGGTAAPSTEAR